jgi:hypothetical protein
MKLQKLKNRMLACVFFLVCALSLNGCFATNLIDGGDDKKKAVASLGDIPDNVPAAITVRATMKECKIAIRQILQDEFGAGIMFISEDFIKTEKTPVADTRFFKTGETLYTVEVALSEATGGNTRVAVAVLTYYESSLMAGGKVDLPEFSKGKRHEFFMALLKIYLSV